MRKKIIIAVGCSVSAFSLLLAGCSGNTTNGDSTNTSGVVTSANAEVTDSNVTTNSGELPYVDISHINLQDEKAGLFQTGTVLFNIDGEIEDDNINATCEAEINHLKEKVYGNNQNIKYYDLTPQSFYDGQIFYSFFYKTSELTGDTVKASIINNNAKVVFESDIKSSMSESQLYSDTFAFAFPYFVFNDGNKGKLYKIVGESSELVGELPGAVFTIWSDGFYQFVGSDDDKSKYGIYSLNGEKLFDKSTYSEIQHNTSNGCFLQVINDSHNMYENSKLYDSNGALLLDPSTLDIGSAKIVGASLLEGENTEGLVKLQIKNVNGSVFWGIVDKNGKWFLEPSNAENIENIREKVGDYYISGNCIFDKNFEIITNTDGFNTDTSSFEDKIVFIKDNSIKRLDTSTGEIKTLFNGN